MTRDNAIKGKTTGSRNEGRQQMERAERAGSGRSGGHESNRAGTDNTAPVAGGKRSKISGGNEGRGGSGPSSDR